MKHASVLPSWLARAAAALLMVLLLCTAQSGKAETALDITAECSFKTSSSKLKFTVMTDKKYTSHWYTDKMKNPSVAITAPKDERIYGVYLCFATIPESYEVQVREGEKWVTRYEGDTRFAHMLYEFPEGAEGVRLYVTAQSSFVLDMNEIFVFGQGEIPDWVQRWEPTPEKVDLLLIATHPDDELIFFCGAVPTYAVERGYTVAVSYYTYSNTTRRSELLNGLWSMGYRCYPVIGEARDKNQSNLNDCYKTAGGEATVVGSYVELIRRLQPKVIVTHDENGEYGHGQHKMVCDAVKRAYDAAADETKYTASAREYGVWQAQKLYIHLYGKAEDYTVVDWDVPLASMGGQTGRELATYAFTYHLTQRGTKYDVANTGAQYNNECFGLYRTQVGEDVEKNDFMEHTDAVPVKAEALTLEDVPGGAVARVTAAPVRTPAPTVQRTATPAPTREHVPAFTFEEEDDFSIFGDSGTKPAQKTATPAPTVAATPEATETPEPVVTPQPTPEPTKAPAAQAAAAFAGDMPEWARGIEGLNERGFLDAGEYVRADETHGLYVYVSPTLRVVITRHYDGGQNMTWFDADIVCDIEAGERPAAIFYDDVKRAKVTVDAAKNAKEHNVVFATNTDYFTYRIGSPRRTGVVIRGGELLIDDAYPEETHVFPNMDTIAIFPDGNVSVAHSYENTGKKLLSQGAETVMSFGPILVRDGEMNPALFTGNNTTSAQPRYAFGMVEPGHYVAILAEGRLDRSDGITMYQLGAMMKRRGCTQAINLDGGQTAVMVFMGKQINLIGKYDGKTNARQTCDILAVGTSDLVGSVQFE